MSWSTLPLLRTLRLGVSKMLTAVEVLIGALRRENPRGPSVDDRMNSKVSVDQYRDQINVSSTDEE